MSRQRELPWGQVEAAYRDMAELLDHPHLGNGAQSMCAVIEHEDGSSAMSIIVAREEHADAYAAMAGRLRVHLNHGRLPSCALEVE